MTQRKVQRWSDLSEQQRRWIVIQGSIQTTLLAIAAADLARRPADQVNGRKLWWGLGLLVQPLGPIAYLLKGRRRK